MSKRPKVIAICGSTRVSSTNLNLINAIRELAKEFLDVEPFTGLSRLPHFNPDIDTDVPPSEVNDFREKLKAASGILICTPEYAMGVPGTLKNAIDWTVSSCEFSHKPTALITASSMGQKAHASLLETLHIIEAGVTEETHLLVPYAKTKINASSEIIDETTLLEVNKVVKALHKEITGHDI